MICRAFPHLLLLLRRIVLFGVFICSPAPIAAQEAGEMGEMQTVIPQEDSPQEAPEEISVGVDEIDDGLIEKRLEEVYRSIPELANIQIEVNAGVVRLSGQIQSKDAHQKALELAERVEGVVSVTDEITHKREIRQRLANVQEKLEKQVNDLVSYLPLLVIAVVVFLVFWFVASLIARWESLYTKITPHVFLQSFLQQIVRGVILFVGFIVVLEILDATALLGTMVGVAGIVGLALGFALRDTVENYIASILLSIRQPFQPFDQIVLEGYEGLVVKLTSRETILMTLDGNHVRIPNATVYKGIITNYSRNPKRQFSFEVGISIAVHIEAARQLALDTLQHTPGVIPDPPALCAVDRLEDFRVLLKFFAWTSQDQFDYLKVRSEAIRAVKEAFEYAGYDRPEPVYRLKVQRRPRTGDEPDLESVPSRKSRPSIPRGFSPICEADVSKDNHIGKQISDEKDENRQEPDLLQSDS